MRIVLCYPVQPRHVQQIRDVAPDATVVDAGQERVAEELLAADVFCGHAKVPVPWDDMVRGGRLRWIQSSAAGLDHCLTPGVVESDIVVTSASGVLADQVAEHTLALMTALSRRLPVFFEAQRRREFVRRPTRDLTGSTVVTIGFGGVGRRIAEVLRPLKVRMLATDWFPYEKPGYVQALLPADRWRELLPEANFLVLAAPLTEVTRGMIDSAALDKLRREAFLVNVARGPLVVQADLVEALKNDRLAGAALDVTETEPPPPDSPLWTAPNLILTPHVGGQSARRIDDMTDFFCDNLRRWLSGQPLKNLVDKRLGFPLRQPSGDAPQP